MTTATEDRRAEMLGLGQAYGSYGAHSWLGDRKYMDRYAGGNVGNGKPGGCEGGCDCRKCSSGDSGTCPNGCANGCGCKSGTNVVEYCNPLSGISNQMSGIGQAPAAPAATGWGTILTVASVSLAAGAGLAYLVTRKRRR